MKRVLLLGWGAVGDTVHAIPAITAIRSQLGSGDEIWFQSVLQQRADVKPHGTVAADVLGPLGLVDRILHREVPGGRWGLAVIEGMVLRAILSRQFARILVLMPFAAMPLGLAWMAGGSRSLSVLRDVQTGGVPSADKTLCRHLLDSVGLHGLGAVTGTEFLPPFLVPPADAVREAEVWMERHRHYPGRRLMAVAPDASYRSNQWPVERFVSLLKRIVAEGGHEVVLCGGSGAVGICREIAAHVPEALVSAGQLSILGCAALFKQCSVLLGLDTGTTHLASACGVPYVAIYGQRGSGRWYFPPCPPGIVLQRDVPCRGCWLAECNQPGHPCISDISVDQVHEALRAATHGHQSCVLPHEGEPVAPAGSLGLSAGMP